METKVLNATLQRRAGFLLTLLLCTNFPIIEGVDQTPVAAKQRRATTRSGEPEVEIYVLESGGAISSLGCNVTEWDTRQVYWWKDKVLINNTEYIEVTDDGRSLRLTKPIDSCLGDYTCRHNKSGPILSYYRVISKPTLKLPPSMHFLEGKELNITCEALASLGPEITWQFCNGTYKDPSDRIELSEDERGVKNAVFVVKGIKTNETGTITCKAKFTKVNGNPTVTADIHVTVVVESIFLKPISVTSWTLFIILIFLFIPLKIMQLEAISRNLTRPERRHQAHLDPMLL